MSFDCVHGVPPPQRAALVYTPPHVFGVIKNGGLLKLRQVIPLFVCLE